MDLMRNCGPIQQTVVQLALSSLLLNELGEFESDVVARLLGAGPGAFR